MAGEYHVVPVGDLVDHDAEDAAEDNCVCRPRVMPVQRLDGSVGWLVVHNALDGRP